MAAPGPHTRTSSAGGRTVRVRSLVALAVAARLVGGVAALGGAALSGNLGGGETRVQVAQLPAPVPAPAADSSAGADTGSPTAPRAGGGAGPSVQQVVARSAPAVVAVRADSGSQARIGSGFIAGAGGLALSNAHVVGDARSVRVRFADGTETTARVLGVDESNDLAVLRVADPPPGVTPLPLGSSRPLVVGDPVIAIGNPFGLERSATTGIVSALKRIISAPNGFEIQNVIQTDAAINQGNSGGPLLDGAGEVIGINTQIATGSGGNDGVGFAVPADTLRPVVNAIVRDGRAEHAWLGVTGRMVTPAMARGLGRPALRGAVVVGVDSRGPAHAAGLRPTSGAPDADVPRGGDVIVEAEGHPVSDMADVSQAVASRAVGEPLRLTVMRDGRRVVLSVRLADRPDDVGMGRVHP